VVVGGFGQPAGVLRYEARSTADPATAWALLARPEEWPAWAPHLRGAWGLADPATGEVERGRRGAVRLLGVVPVPATITAKDDGRSWTWRVGAAVDMEHRVDPRADGCAVVITISAPAPLEQALRATYGPVVALLLRRLSRTAAARPRPTRTGTPRG